MRESSQQDWFVQRLDRLRAAAGYPTQAQLLACDTDNGLNKSSLSDLLAGRFVRVPPWERISAFVTACANAAQAQHRDLSLVDELRQMRSDHDTLASLFESAIKATIPQATVNRTSAASLMLGGESGNGFRSWKSGHYSIVVMDVEGFGDRSRTNPHQLGVREGLYRAARNALDIAGLSWTDCYHEDRGDAVFILIPAHMPKMRLAALLPLTLVAELRTHNDSCPAEQRIRLRMALHAGEVNFDDNGVAGASINHTFRLNAATLLKAELAASPGLLAIIASDWFYDDVIRHTTGGGAATYRPVRVSEKETSTVGWISLPDNPYSSTATSPATRAGADQDRATSKVENQTSVSAPGATHYQQQVAEGGAGAQGPGSSATVNNHYPPTSDSTGGQR